MDGKFVITTTVCKIMLVTNRCL